jgi:hypothetical protein
MVENVIIKKDDIQNRIHTIGNVHVMPDSDLATLYGVENKALNRSVKRHIARFPIEFMFQLTTDEYHSLRSQFVTLENESHLRFQIGASNHKQNLRSQFVTSDQQGGRLCGR